MVWATNVVGLILFFALSLLEPTRTSFKSTGVSKHKSGLTLPSTSTLDSSLCVYFRMVVGLQKDSTPWLAVFRSEMRFFRLSFVSVFGHGGNVAARHVRIRHEDYRIRCTETSYTTHYNESKHTCFGPTNSTHAIGCFDEPTAEIFQK